MMKDWIRWKRASSSARELVAASWTVDREGTEEFAGLRPPSVAPPLPESTIRAWVERFMPGGVPCR